MSMKELIDISRRYGADSRYVLAGGGNTSLKEGNTLYVKASGHPLATIDEEGFARMDQDALDALWSKDYPADKERREELVLADMMASRSKGEDKRPSVEALLHSLLRGKFVVHTHPGLVNGLTCGQRGEEFSQNLFGDDPLWIPLVDPGFVLAKTVKDRIDERTARGKPYPAFILLENHGVFVYADSVEEIDRIYGRIFSRLNDVITGKPDRGYKRPDLPFDELAREAKLLGGEDMLVEGVVNADLNGYLISREAFLPLSRPFSPDHIVYSGLEPLWLEDWKGLAKKWKEYEAKWKRPPKSACVKGKGALLFARGEKALKAAVELFLDSVRVAYYSEFFGGPHPMDDESIRFIANWEVEKYRAQQST